MRACPISSRRDLSSLVSCGSGGAPLPVEVAKIFERKIGMKLKSGWGMTETCSPGTAHPDEGPDKPGSIGLMLPGIEMDVVALDDPKKVLPPGEVGEIRIRGPNVTKGYWNRPQETAEAFVGDRFLTGDIGYMDADGYFYLVDRKKDMIISGGFNVYPQMIEQAIYEHPAVQEVIVIGIPDDYRGEAAKAFVKLRAGAKPFTLDELKAFLGRQARQARNSRRARFRRRSAAHLGRQTLAPRIAQAAAARPQRNNSHQEVASERHARQLAVVPRSRGRRDRNRSRKIHSLTGGSDGSQLSARKKWRFVTKCGPSSGTTCRRRRGRSCRRAVISPSTRWSTGGAS